MKQTPKLLVEMREVKWTWSNRINMHVNILKIPITTCFWDAVNVQWHFNSEISNEFHARNRETSSFAFSFLALPRCCRRQVVNFYFFFVFHVYSTPVHSTRTNAITLIRLEWKIMRIYVRWQQLSEKEIDNSVWPLHTLSIQQYNSKYVELTFPFVNSFMSHRTKAINRT